MEKANPSKGIIIEYKDIFFLLNYEKRMTIVKG